MLTRLSLLLLLAWPVWAGDPAAAQVLLTPFAETQPAPRQRVSVVKRQHGQRTLVVNYPWRVHSRPSIEVRLVTGKDPGPPTVRPMFFVGDYLKAEMTVAVYRARDEATGVETHESLKVKSLDFDIFGRRNWLGKPASTVLHRFTSSDPAPGDTALYYLLSAWELERDLLYLDLPEEAFAQPGKLYIWFLSEHSVVWSETLDWQGRRQ
jgi:hypothetical protein